MVPIIMTKFAPAHKRDQTRLHRLCCGATRMLQCGMASFAVTAMLSGCGAGGAIFGGYGLPQTSALPDGEWPRLADATFPTDGPDPATGDAMIASMTIAAATAAARAETLAGPIMTEAEAARLRPAGRRSR
ncbi:MAG: hypothetical protein ACJA1L_000761 [Paracoccaceae bacterium]|jgi:hypothetical protein